MREPPFQLGASQRQAVLAGILDVAQRRQWRVWAAQVRTDHVRVVVEGPAGPERIMTDLKASATRQLARLPGQPPRSRWWARHGSTIWLLREADFRHAMAYVARSQGQAMDLYIDPAW